MNNDFDLARYTWEWDLKVKGKHRKLRKSEGSCQIWETIRFSNMDQLIVY